MNADLNTMRNTGGDDLVVLCGGVHLRHEKKMHDIQLAQHLSAYCRVLYVDPPISHLTPRRHPEVAELLQRPRLRGVSDTLAHLTPVAAPRPLTAPVAPSTGVLVRRSIARAVRELGVTPRAIVTTWPFLDVYDACPGAQRVYWWTDDPGAGAEMWGMDRARLIAGDRAVARRSDFVLSVSEAKAQGLRADGIDARFFPNGCDAATMASTGSVPKAAGVHLPAPVAGFVGLLNSRTDLSLLEAVADRMSLLIVGPGAPELDWPRFEVLCERPNVTWVGQRPFEEVPSYLGHVDVGLVPYANNQFNRNSSPLKALEYLAAGLPVVSTGLPGVRWMANEHIVFADDAPAFAAAAWSTARRRSDAATVADRRAFAAGQSWDRRARSLVAMLGIADPDAADTGHRQTTPVLTGAGPDPERGADDE